MRDFVAPLFGRTDRLTATKPRAAVAPTHEYQNLDIGRLIMPATGIHSDGSPDRPRGQINKGKETHVVNGQAPRGNSARHQAARMPRRHRQQRWFQPPQRGIRLDHNIIRCPNQVYHAVALQAKAIHDASTAGGASNDVAETVNVAAAC
ncbi:hypothetical protein BZL30_0243 [Mycobacterium kansasii]|uniref:Uncharacterized protein n=1 Tax=Mycobacterium kansasii TaxID=1768 RepID=A0A1V3XSS0_MYCKA|nr:hypothetical protein BZL30_0243 [Mycobacterium kansasii]OOK84630.1 hypothetical protein BZL29_1568 [Mycobacterium kansasii]